MPHQSIIPFRVRYLSIDGFPGYEVGDDGSVWTCWRRGKPHGLTDTWLPLKGSPQRRGHLCVCLVCDGRKFYRHIHVLVLEAFVGPCPEGMECCHDPDPDPSNNWVGNLRWGTRKDNYEDSVRHGTAYILPDGRRGEENPSSKLTRDLVGRIFKIRCDEGAGAKTICRALGLPDAMRGAVDGIIRGQSWNDVTGMPPYKPQSHKRGRRPDQTPTEESRDVAPYVAPSDNISDRKGVQGTFF